MKEMTLPGFERFWTAYGYKVGRKDALRAWTKNKLEEIADDIIAAIPAYDAHLAANKWKQKKHASSWLNAESWNDEFPEAKAVNWQASMTVSRASSSDDARRRAIIWNSLPDHLTNGQKQREIDRILSNMETAK